MAPPSASPGTGAAAWVLVPREARVDDVDGDAGTGSEAHVAFKLVPPPRVCRVSVERARHDGDPDPDAVTPPARVHGADASGRLLFAFPPPRAQLGVCRPVASSDHRNAKGKLVPLPALPEQFGSALDEAAPTGIVLDRESLSGDGFFVALLQTPTSASSPVAAVVFTSEANNWFVTDLPGEDRWRGFTASSVVAHDRGVNADAVRLAFVDPSRRGLLLLHPRRLAAARFIDLPQGGGAVDSTNGNLVCVLFEEVPEGVRVRMWSLSEDETRWTEKDAFGSVWPLRGPSRLGPIDPTTLTRIFVGMGGGMSFCLEVTPDEMMLRRVDGACLESLVCPLQAAPQSTWLAAMSSGKHAGMLALQAIQKSREYADTIPDIVQVVGSTLGLPYTAAAVATANAFKMANKYFAISERVCYWMWKNRPGAPAVLSTVVGSKQEAEDALKEWEAFGKPANMAIDPAPEGLTQEEWKDICEDFTQRGAGTLVQHFDYVIVDRPPQ